MVSRTRVGAESPRLLGQASCALASNSIRGLGPTATTTRSPDLNALGNTRCIHGGSLPTDFRPVSGRLAPQPSIPGASMRGIQSERYRSVIREEGEGFAHSFMDESDRIRYHRPRRNCDILGANSNTLHPNQSRTVFTARTSYQEVCPRTLQPASPEFESGELPQGLSKYSLLNPYSLSLLPPSADHHSHPSFFAHLR